MQRDQGADALWAAISAKAVDPSEEIGSRLRELYFSERGVRGNPAHQIAGYLPPAEGKQFLMAEFERCSVTASLLVTSRRVQRATSSFNHY